MTSSLQPTTLQIARLARGLSLKALGERSGISAATLSRIESGQRPTTPSELEILARAVELPVAALTRSTVSEGLGLSGFYHRKLSRAGAKPVQAIESQCVLHAVALKKLFGMVDAPLGRDLFTLDLADGRQRPDKAAQMTRAAIRIPRGPVRDIFEVVERAGCVVIHTDFEVPEIDALYQKVSGVPPIIWVNSRKPLDRVRFSVAHELGHLILHEERPEDNSLAEREADEFAAAFLMPRDDFRGECPTRLRVPELIEMKRRWRCAMSAIARRARDVGRITESDYRSLMVQMSKRGWRKVEPCSIGGETPSVLARTIRQCMDECQLTTFELAEELALPHEALQAWTQPFPGCSTVGGVAQAPTLRYVPAGDAEWDKRAPDNLDPPNPRSSGW